MLVVMRTVLVLVMVVEVAVALIPSALVGKTGTVMATAMGLTVKAGWHTMREIPLHCTTPLNFDAKSGRSSVKGPEWRGSLACVTRGN